MRDLFRSFERHGVDYLLIGGQATILYGASQFTEDVDLWVRPTGEEILRFLRALADLDAQVYKLTPPVTPPFVRRGHGFHFMIPRVGDDLPTFIDLMGRPPRVGSFARARARSRTLSPTWGGAVPTAAPEDLADLKKTDRPDDYPIISRLARLRLAEERLPTARTLTWALANTFVVDDLEAIIRAHGDAIPPSVAADDPAVSLLLACRARGREPTGRNVDRAAAILSRRALELQRLGRAYWRPVRDDLKALRAAGVLIRVGTPVRELLPP